MLLEKISDKSMRQISERIGVGSDDVSISFLNPYSYLVLRKRVDLYSSVDEFYCDGALLATLMSLAGKKCSRISFDMTSLAPIVFSSAEKSGASVYFIGSREGVAQEAVEKIKEQYGCLKVVGIRHGFFNSADERVAALHDIECSAPDIVIVGMGTPHQEKFIGELKESGWKGQAYTCGGFLHQTARGGLKYYPDLLNRMNLRWLYRMYSEPKLMKRYFLYYPMFFFFFAKDCFLLFRKSV